jgi:hypothetical protein
MFDNACFISLFPLVAFCVVCCVYASVLMNVEQEDGGDAKDKKRTCVGVWASDLLQLWGSREDKWISGILIDIEHKIV